MVWGMWWEMMLAVNWKLFQETSGQIFIKMIISLFTYEWSELNHYLKLENVYRVGYMDKTILYLSIWIDISFEKWVGYSYSYSYILEMCKSSCLYSQKTKVIPWSVTKTLALGRLKILLAIPKWKSGKDSFFKPDRFEKTEFHQHQNKLKTGIYYHCWQHIIRVCGQKQGDCQKQNSLSKNFSVTIGILHRENTSIKRRSYFWQKVCFSRTEGTIYLTRWFYRKHLS